VSNNKRLHVVVRADLDPGLGSAQLCHATDEFRKRYPDEDTGDTMIVLEARDQKQLMQLCIAATINGIACEPFFEPDLEDGLTAAAFGSDAKKLLANLPKAFAGVKRSNGPVQKTVADLTVEKKIAVAISNPCSIVSKALARSTECARRRL
jgi:hypothetical protein